MCVCVFGPLLSRPGVCDLCLSGGHTVQEKMSDDTEISNDISVEESSLYDVSQMIVDLSMGENLAATCYWTVNSSEFLLTTSLLNCTWRSIMQQTADHTITWAKSVWLPLYVLMLHICAWWGFSQYVLCNFTERLICLSTLKFPLTIRPLCTLPFSKKLIT